MATPAEAMKAPSNKRRKINGKGDFVEGFEIVSEVPQFANANKKQAKVIDKVMMTARKAEDTIKAATPRRSDRKKEL